MRKKKERHPSLSNQLRRIISDWPESRYRIAKETGISESLLSKLMTGERGISLETLDVLGKYLHLELRVKTSKKTEANS